MIIPVDHSSFPGTTPLLVGRDREQDVLRDHLAAAIANHGSLVLLGGEAGVGKTALAETICREATGQGALVLVGRCYDLTETPPYGPWVELFGRYTSGDDSPALPAAFARRGAVGEVASQGALFQQTLDFLSAMPARRAVVLLLDDIHWADPASLDLLRVLARSASALPLLVLATYRADEVPRRHPLYALLPQLVRESHAGRVDLRPLDDHVVRSLCVRQYHLPGPDLERLVRYLQSRAEGNALFTGELLRSLAESGTLRREGEAWWLDDLQHAALPPLLRQVIDRRVARLDAESQRVLALAAVIGQEASLVVLGPFAETDDESLLAAIAAACEAHLLIEAPDGLQVRFAHALIREALYEGISPARRRLMHRDIAELLAAAPQPDVDAVAAHFQRASDRRAVTWLIRAGERAQLAYAWLTAIERYEAALALVGESGGEMAQRGWLHYRIGSLRRAGTPDQSIPHFDTALRIAAAIGDRALAAAARYTRGLCLTYTTGPLAGIPEMTAGADALEALSPEEQARLDIDPDEHGLPVASNPRGFLVCLLATSGRIAEAIAMGEAMREGEPRRTPLGELSWAHYGARDAGLSTAYALAGRPAASDAAFERACNRFRQQGNYSTLGSVVTLHLLWMHLHYHTDRPDDHERLAEEATTARRLASMIAARYDRIGICRSMRWRAGGRRRRKRRRPRSMCRTSKGGVESPLPCSRRSHARRARRRRRGHTSALCCRPARRQPPARWSGGSPACRSSVSRRRSRWTRAIPSR